MDDPPPGLGMVVMEFVTERQPLFERQVWLLEG
jgi:hypothetical protein